VNDRFGWHFSPPTAILETSTSSGSPEKEAASDEREDANSYAGSHACQETSVVKTLGRSTHKIPMQEVSEGQGCEQYSNSAQEIKNSHVAPVYPAVGHSPVTAITSPIPARMPIAQPRPALSAPRVHHRNPDSAILSVPGQRGSPPKSR
jgi:hypothetical protein